MEDNSSPALPGLKPVLELLEEEPRRALKVYCKRNLRGQAVQKITALCHKNRVPLEYVDGPFLDSLCGNAAGGHVSHQGMVAILCGAASTSPEKLLASAAGAPLPVILALDQIQDPGNFGALARTAYALGAAGIISPRHKSASLGPGAMRASAGALEKLPVAQAVNLARTLDLAEERGFIIYGATGNPDFSPQNAFDFQFEYPAIITLGNENKGIRPGVAKRCGVFLAIPFARPFDSLNIAQAGAILLGLFASRFRR